MPHTGHDTSNALRQRRIRQLQWACCVLWLSVTLAVIWFARALDRPVHGWPLGFWLAAQGVVIFYVLLVAVYAWAVNRLESPEPAPDTPSDKA